MAKDETSMRVATAGGGGGREDVSTRLEPLSQLQMRLFMRVEDWVTKYKRKPDGSRIRARQGRACPCSSSMIS